MGLCLEEPRRKCLRRALELHCSLPLDQRAGRGVVPLAVVSLIYNGDGKLHTVY
jgi:hypothetical protein